MLRHQPAGKPASIRVIPLWNANAISPRIYYHIQLLSAIDCAGVGHGQYSFSLRALGSQQWAGNVQPTHVQIEMPDSVQYMSARWH